MKLVIFTTCKPLRDDDAWRQEQAIKSWTLLKGIEKKIVVFGDDEGVSELCEKYDIVHEPEVTCLAGVPLVRAMFETAATYASPEDYLLWTNADMMYFSDMIDTILAFDKKRKEEDIEDFIFVGARTDWHNPQPLENLTKEHFFGNIRMNPMVGNQRLSTTSWPPSSKYECHPVQDDGIDYVVHSPTAYIGKIDPRLVIAGTRHDTLLLQYAIDSGYFACNTGRTITAIHQNHGITQSTKQREKQVLEPNNMRCGECKYWRLGCNSCSWGATINEEGRITFLPSGAVLRAAPPPRLLPPPRAWSMFR